MEEVNQRTTDTSLQGKVIVITGASSGVGRATALALARKSASVVLAARRDTVLDEVAEECKTLGGKALVVPTDVTDGDAIKILAAAAEEWGGHIDVWVNNAGVLAAGPFEETPVDVHDQVIKTNLLGYIHGAHAVLPIFKQQGYGILVNNISVGGWFPTPYAVGYSASKFGLRGFSEALRGELHQWPQIHVCDLYPAFLDTPGIQHAGNYTGHPLRPAPPVYDPQKVAEAISRLVLHPRPSTVVGGMASFLRIAHGLFPALSRNITANTMEFYFKRADSIKNTDGNLFEPAEYGTSIHGGWRTPPTPRQKAFTNALLVAGLAVGLLWLGKRV
ncbi:SDR family oxidoreductase [Flavisolibacter tropicus]|uniref:Short-chain dehydrogenase n=1 Tax=Flavisolibacter tropicus TaxID=1492898 RepID=A0A172TQ12_9BACT|nr:SDR family oxidoreductase [Flavisolibacter tropicus]ANE49159.1 short-chain dehydrogenase [Flavisolibacter tropicus]